MRAQESRVSVALGDHPAVYYPLEVWDLSLDELDMFTEEIIDELGVIPWAENADVPSFSTVSARTTQHNWGASGSSSEIILQVSTGAAGGIGATAIVAAIKTVYEKLKDRSRGDSWGSVPSIEDAVRIATAHIHQHYDVAIDKLTVTRSSLDAEAGRHDLDFVHEDGRKFGATVGAIAEMPSCTRVWAEGGDLMPRPAPTPPGPGN